MRGDTCGRVMAVEDGPPRETADKRTDRGTRMAAKVLMVDDEPDLELLVRQRFRRQVRAGIYEFIFARNGVEALDRVRTDPGIEVVFSDINMPVMDGLTLLARLRQEQEQVGTVVVSAYGDLPNIRAAMNRGAFDFLTKPIDFHDFEVTLGKTLDQVRRLKQAADDHDRLLALQRDLETAAQIQQSFLPPTPPPFASRHDFAVHAAMLPALAVGGDFYDYFLLEDGAGPGRERLGVVVGDVTGKGMPAALFMAVTRTLLRAVALGGADPGVCLGRVNRQLLRDSSADLFVTLFYAILDPRTGELCYSFGGHNPPYLLRAGADPEPLDGRGLVVGVLEGAVYETRRVALRPGDGLFVYTDGVPEARNECGDLFSEDRLLAALQRAEDAGPEELVQIILADVQRFHGGAAQSDDITTLALRYAGPEPAGQGVGP